MTTKTSIVNRALQSFGSRTTVTDAELVDESSNEAIQANLVYDSCRDELLRMAPWDCALKTANLTYITSTPGTPENTSPATQLWQPGQPSPPWAYEYQYPVDCLRACWLIPSMLTGFAGVPITTAVTGGFPTNWSGEPVRYKVQVDQFYPVLSATVFGGGGLGYVIGEVITLAQAAQGEAPVGAPVQLRVKTIGALGVIGTVDVINQIIGEDLPMGGSYFGIQQNPVAQGSTTGSGTGASFTLVQGDQGPQRVILTNQEFALMTYVQQVTNPNVMDPLFIEAWVQVLGAKINFGLDGDLKLSNNCIGKANEWITQARKVDGNEGLTINDVTPDFIRIRGIDWDNGVSGPYSNYDWGNLWASY